MKNWMTFILLVCCSTVYGQYHALETPQASPKINETQRIGLTDITVNYHAPAVRGRKVWEGLVPFNGNPVPWRAGANINTTIAFSTDVMIEGKPLAAGSYGFHTIPSDGEWELIFASNDNLWGSYYLDLEKEVALRVKVKTETAPMREYMSFEFMNRTDNAITVALEWEKLRVPFEVAVDLNKTVVESFRYQLRGHTTNSWAAWDAAAQWCLGQDTNLEEALTWAERSINGGFGGFRADKNLTNLGTKASILWKLGRKEESDKILDEAIALGNDPNAMFNLGRTVLVQERKEKSLQIFQAAVDKFPNTWYVHLGHSRALSANGAYKKAVKSIDLALKGAPDNYKAYLNGLKDKLQKNEPI